MIINASGGNADAVMTVAQTLSDTQKTQARTNIGALSSADSAVKSANIASNAVSTAKIANSAITRDKLATNALFSPGSGVTASRSITASDIGFTLFAQGANNDCTFTLTQAVSTTLPAGAEIAFCWINASSPITLTFNGVETIHMGDGRRGGSGKIHSYKLLEHGAMAAIKKYANSTADVWIVTGSVEAV